MILIFLTTITSLMEIRLSRPCIEDPSRYIAECYLGRRIAIGKLCDLLREAGARGLKCSTNLGVLRFELEDKSVMLYQSGRIDIRRIRNSEEAQVYLEKIFSLCRHEV